MATACGFVLWVIAVTGPYSAVPLNAFDTAKECRDEVKARYDPKEKRFLDICLPSGMKPR